MADEPTTEDLAADLFAVKKTAMKTAARWAGAQPFTNILLLILIGVISWLAKYSLDVAIPKHLIEIQTGYERIELQQSKQTQGIIDSYDKQMNRQEKSLERYETLLRESLDERTPPPPKRVP